MYILYIYTYICIYHTHIYMYILYTHIYIYVYDGINVICVCVTCHEMLTFFSLITLTSINRTIDRSNIGRAKRKD